MNVALYTNSISAHQLPLAREIVKRVGPDNFRYIYTGKMLQGGGQEVNAPESWIFREEECGDLQQWLNDCDLLLSGNRALPLFVRRAARGLKTYYQSERWFKPLNLGPGVVFPGRFRMLVPRYRQMAKGFVRWLNEDPNARYLAIGPWAKKDMLSIGVRPDKIGDWGYFVDTGRGRRELGATTDDSVVRVLYIGRLLRLKHVDTIVRAIAYLMRLPAAGRLVRTYALTIVGDGPEKRRLQILANTLGKAERQAQWYTFRSSVSIQEVRDVIRDHDVVVFASDANDGWGAVVSEALSEGVPVIGTYETGASAALLPDGQLFHSGNYSELAKKLASLHLGIATSFLPYEYTPMGAAERLVDCS